jgi:hypothetical protein
LPWAPTPGWFGDFNDETENANDIMSTVLTKDRHSHKPQLVYAAVGPHDAKLTGFARRTIRPEGFQRD